MRIKDRPEYKRKGQIPTMRPEDSVASAVAVMSERNQGAVVNIMSQGDVVSYTWPRLLGCLTEHTKATFEPGPFLFVALGGAVTFMLVVIALILAMN